MFCHDGGDDCLVVKWNLKNGENGDQCRSMWDHNKIIMKLSTATSLPAVKWWALLASTTGEKTSRPSQFNSSHNWWCFLQTLYDQVKRCSGGSDAQCLQPSGWATQLHSLLKRIILWKRDFYLDPIVAGMPGAGSQYSVMGRPQDPRSSMFGSSINLNGEFSSAKSKTKVKWTFTYVYTFGSLIKLNGEFSVFGGLKATKTKCIAMVRWRFT